MQNEPSTSDRRVEWYHPGEVIIVAHVRKGAAATELLHQRLRQHLSAAALVADPTSLRSFRFDAPHEPDSLVFFVQKLANSGSARTVKDVVERLHERLDVLGTDDLDVVAAMPHWHLKAHEGFGGGSPGSLPAPVYPDRLRDRPTYRDYRPVSPALNVGDGQPIRVAVLDTRWNPQTVRQRAAHFRDSANNRQLMETVELLETSARDFAQYDEEWREVGQHHADRGTQVGGEPSPYHMPDHGLFVAGLIHTMAPQARLSYAPVLDEMGVGDLSMLLLGLQGVLQAKTEDEPQIINLSLGFLPHPARLPAAWYGLERPRDPMYLHSPEMFDPKRDQRWVATNRDHVDHTVDLLQVGLRELGRYLSLNNCLVVAAAGNDSLLATEHGHIRMQPRLPARFETVLGVAATTDNPSQAAPYSNLGDERELGDHVATFGGNVTDSLQPADGVVGIYSGEFPDGQVNETGWAHWSGTSFATGLISGVAANLWGTNPTLRGREILAEVHAAASASGQYVPELRAPSIAIEGSWRH